MTITATMAPGVFWWLSGFIFVKKNDYKSSSIPGFIFVRGNVHKNKSWHHVATNRLSPTSSMPPQVVLDSTLPMHAPGGRDIHYLGHLRGKTRHQDRQPHVTAANRDNETRGMGKKLPRTPFLTKCSLFLSPLLTCTISIM